MKTPKICTNSRLNAVVALVMLWFALAWNSFAHAACGPVPNTYPLFGGSGFTTDKDWTVNGLPVGKGSKVDASPFRTAVDANGIVTNTAQSLPDISPASFVGSVAAAGTNTSTSIAAGDYDKITKPAGGATTFTGGTYHINVLGDTGSNV